MLTNIICNKDTVININDKDEIELLLKVDNDLKLVLNVKENAHAIVQIRITGKDHSLMITSNIEKYAKLTIIYWNEADNLRINEEVEIYDHADYRIAYGELELKKVEREAHYHLLGYQARIDLVSVAIIKDYIKASLNAHHQGKESFSHIQTYGVLLKDGEYDMVANGHIKKKATLSKSHQVSRVLTLTDKQKAKVTPLLLIDENDVEASHAMSIGQLDENQLYYLQSRGLSKNEALGLMSRGYLMAMTSIIDDEELKLKIQTQINKKVENTCWM